MDTIFKYPIEITDKQTLQIPSQSSPLYAGLDPNGKPCIWCCVDSNKTNHEVTVYVVGTGNPMPERNPTLIYVGSFVQRSFVWHIFMR